MQKSGPESKSHSLSATQDARKGNDVVPRARREESSSSSGNNNSSGGHNNQRRREGRQYRGGGGGGRDRRDSNSHHQPTSAAEADADLVYAMQLSLEEGKKDNNSKQQQQRSGNFLLNFQYTPNSSGNNNRAGNFRERKHTYKNHAFNKESFLLANCHFLLSPLEEEKNLLSAIDADHAVDWMSVEHVFYPTEELPSCPICLEIPVAGKITKCGHIFCSPCILHYLCTGEKSWSRCPLCFDAIYKKALKSVSFRIQERVCTGQEGEFVLLHRTKSSLIPFLDNKNSDSESRDVRTDSSLFTRVTVATDISDIIAKEYRELQNALKNEENGSAHSIFLRQAIEECLARQHQWEQTYAQQQKQKTASSSTSLSAGSSDSSGSSKGREGEEKAKGTGWDEPDPTHTKSPSIKPVSNKPKARAQLQRITPLSSFSSCSQPSSASSSPQSAILHDSVTGGLETLSLSENNKKETSSSDTFSSPGSVPTLIDTSAASSASLSTSAATSTTSRGSFRRDSEKEPIATAATAATATTATTAKFSFNPSARSFSFSPSNSTTEDKEDDASVKLHLPSEDSTATATAATTATATTATTNGEKSSTSTTAIDGERTYSYYQSKDGACVFLHAFNYRCLKREYGSEENFPPSLHGKIIALDKHVQTYETRTKLRFVSHLPMNTTFYLALVDLSPLLSTATNRAFAGELHDIQRRRAAELKRAEQLEKRRLARLGLSAPTEQSDVGLLDYTFINGFAMENEEGQFPELPLDTPSGAPSAAATLGWSDIAERGFGASNLYPALEPSTSSKNPLSKAKETAPVVSATASPLLSSVPSSVPQSPILEATLFAPRSSSAWGASPASTLFTSTSPVTKPLASAKSAGKKKTVWAPLKLG